MNYPGDRAFTLIELLVVISIVAVLVAILLPALALARQHGRMICEMAGSRELGRAYIGYALDHDGELLVGYTDDEPGTDEHKQPLSGEPAIRYPWRLVAYIDHHLDGAILINDQREIVERQAARSGFPGAWQYQVSLIPSLGLNYFNLGGDAENTDNNMPGWIRNMDEAVDPSRLIVFGSARMNDTPGQFIPGYFQLHAPNSNARQWVAEYHQEGLAERWGYVHPRWCGDSAVFAHLDGHSELLNTDEMRDMTRWSNQAAIAGDPDWRPASHP